MPRQKLPPRIVRTPLAETRAALAAQAGGDDGREAHAKLVRIDVQKLREQGALVDIDVHGIGAFTGFTSWEELGVPVEDVRRSRLKRGTKDLLPKEYAGRLRSLETRFRQSLDRHSFDLAGFRPYRFVPYSAYQDWREEFRRLQADLRNLKREVIAHYDDIVAGVRRDFTAIANEAWDAIQARRPAEKPDFAVVVRGYGAVDSREKFVEVVVGIVLRQLPKKKDVAHIVYVEYFNALVVTGADLDEELARIEELRAEMEQSKTEQYRQQAERDAIGQIEAMRVETERQRQIAMRLAELDHAKEMLADVVSPFDEMCGQFRARIYSDVQEIRTSIAKNGYVRGKVAERARGLLDLYRLIGAATNDQELERLLIALCDKLAALPVTDGEVRATKYDAASVQAALGDIAELTHAAAGEVGKAARAHTRARRLDLDDDGAGDFAPRSEGVG